MPIVREIDGVVVVALRGEIDAYGAPQLHERLRAVVEEQGARVVVLDLAAVTFLDSSALGAVVGMLRRLRERDGRLLIVRPRGAAGRIFELTGLDAVLELHADRGSAISAARA